MRRSTLIAMGILVVLLGGMMWLLNFYVDQLKPELEAKKALTGELRSDIAPGSEIRLIRVLEAPKGIIEGGKQNGLNLEATPGEASWKADATGAAFATRLAQAASKRYGPERPIQWLKVTLAKPGGNGEVVFGFRVGDDRGVIQVMRRDEAPPR